MGAKTLKTKIGDHVRLADSEGQFEVVGKDRSILILRSGAGKKSRVHYKKVAEILPPEEVGSLADALEVEEPEGVTRKKSPPGIDLEALEAESSQILVKRMKFDHAHVLAESWYVVAKDKRSARSFNTYNRSLGRKQKLETVVREHAIENDEDLERRVKRLEKNGYKRFEG